jgi:hypothetical protein
MSSFKLSSANANRVSSVLIKSVEKGKPKEVELLDKNNKVIQIIKDFNKYDNKVFTDDGGNLTMRISGNLFDVKSSDEVNRELLEAGLEEKKPTPQEKGYVELTDKQKEDKLVDRIKNNKVVRSKVQKAVAQALVSYRQAIGSDDLKNKDLYKGFVTKRGSISTKKILKAIEDGTIDLNETDMAKIFISMFDVHKPVEFLTKGDKLVYYDDKEKRYKEFSKTKSDVVKRYVVRNATEIEGRDIEFRGAQKIGLGRLLKDIITGESESIKKKEFTPDPARLPDIPLNLEQQAISEKIEKFINKYPSSKKEFEKNPLGFIENLMTGDNKITKDTPVEEIEAVVGFGETVLPEVPTAKPKPVEEELKEQEATAKPAPVLKKERNIFINVPDDELEKIIRSKAKVAGISIPPSEARSDRVMKTLMKDLRGQDGGDGKLQVGGIKNLLKNAGYEENEYITKLIPTPPEQVKARGQVGVKAVPVKLPEKMTFESDKIPEVDVEETAERKRGGGWHLNKENKGTLRPKFITPSVNVLQPSEQDIQADFDEWAIFDFVQPINNYGAEGNLNNNPLKRMARVEDETRFRNAGIDLQPALSSVFTNREVNDNQTQMALDMLPPLMPDTSNQPRQVYNVSEYEVKSYDINNDRTAIEYQSPYDNMTPIVLTNDQIRRSVLYGRVP